ncbi:TPA: hypothetical protein QHQ25_002210 [Klebsiella pneumoniae]|nr:hypothetical protein [Klebsiella pneumoniae]
MTITLQAVNELIQSLESAGELSIKERKYLELAKAYLDVAAENVALKALIPENWQMHDVLHQLIVARPGGVYFNKWEKLIVGVLNETPATDRIVAGIKADGVALAKSAFEKHIQSPSCYQDEMVGMESALSIACQVESQLREGADK